MMCPPKADTVDLVGFPQNSITVNARRIDLCIGGATGETLAPTKIKLPFEVGLTEQVGKLSVTVSVCFLEEERVLEGGAHPKCLPSYCLGGKGSEKMTVEGLTGIRELLCLLFSRKIVS